MKNVIRKTNRAFTLAEVLITLGVIGVVAALTLPTLINEHRISQWETALKREKNNSQRMLQSRNDFAHDLAMVSFNEFVGRDVRPVKVS